MCGGGDRHNTHPHDDAEEAGYLRHEMIPSANALFGFLFIDSANDVLLVSEHKNEQHEENGELSSERDHNALFHS